MPMRRLLFLLSLPLLAQNQLKTPIAIGYYDMTTQTNGTSFALNTAAGAAWLAFSFPAQASKTLNTVYVYAGVNGTLGSSDLVATLYSDSSGLPGSSIQASSTVVSTPTGAAVVEFTGFTSALTAGTQYWIVLTNANGTPTTNYPSYLEGASVGGPYWVFGSNAYGWSSLTSTNAGSTWSYQRTTSNMMLGYSDSTFEGRFFSGFTAEGLCSHGATYVGVSFKLPANATYNVIGASFQVRKTGTPGTMSYELWNGTTSLGTSVAVPVNDIVTSTGWITSYFSSDIALTGGVTYGLTILDNDGSDTVSNEYCTQSVTIPNVAAMLALKPMDGTLSEYSSTNSGTSFTTTTTAASTFAILLDTNGEFASQGGSSIIPVYPIQ